MKWLNLLLVSSVFCTACQSIDDSNEKSDNKAEVENKTNTSVKTKESKEPGKKVNDTTNNKEKVEIKEPKTISKSIISDVENKEYDSPESVLSYFKSKVDKNTSDFIDIIHTNQYKAYSILNMKYHIKEADGALLTLGHIYKNENNKYKIKFVLVDGLFKVGEKPQYNKQKINGVSYEYYIGDIKETKIIDLQYQIVDKSKTTEFSMRSDIDN